MGLFTNSFFHKKFDRSRARVIFRQSLLMLAGLRISDCYCRRTAQQAGAQRASGARPKFPHKSRSLINHLKSMRSNPLAGSSRMISLVDMAAAQRVAAFCAEPLTWVTGAVTCTS
jgi:hypothetical protein